MTSSNDNDAQQHSMDFACATTDLVTDNGAQNEEASWVTLDASSEVTSWTHSRDLREVRERNKSLRVIFEAEGMVYGADVTDHEELSKRFKKAVTLRSSRISDVMCRLKAAKCLDLCFLVDITGSMSEYMAAVKNQIRAIVHNLVTTATKTVASVTVQKIRLAFVGYRDFGDDKQLVMLNFTNSIDAFHKFCATVVPSGGGGDGPEDVFGGLEKVIGLGWSTDGSTRMLFHIADYPCHGTEYHNVSSDSYPGGDPNGRSLDAMLKQLAENGVKYHFGRITNYTDLMVSKFSTTMVALGGDELVVCDLKDADQLLNTVVSTTSIAVAEVGLSQHTQRFVPPGGFDKTVPSWAEMSKIQGLLLAYEMPTTINDVINEVALKAKKPVKAVFLCAPKPFAEGAERVAYFGRDVTSGDQSPMDIVLKRYTYTKGFINTPVMYESAIQVQTIAAYLASMFCSRMLEKVGQGYRIQFLKGQVFCYKIPSSGQTVYMTSERRYPANCDYLRFSNNMDYSMLEQTAKMKGVDLEYVKQLISPIGHINCGFLMVVDLQGILNPSEQKIELTDPAPSIVSTRHVSVVQTSVSRE